MVDVICDTSFLIHLATKKIKNIDNLETEIGQINFVIPDTVKNELEKLCTNENKKLEAKATLIFIKNLRTIPISGNYADDALVSYVKEHGGMIATMDKELKNKAKSLGSSIITFSSDRIILDS
ncbi:MAG: twitching motility protein PilT [Marine Group I thaumarchaeote]|nr:MAG: twitching motility protein PilT [Marine Group I thaumarchaeote]